MTDVLYVPKLTSNLFSVHTAVLKGNMILFGHRYFWIQKKKGKLVGTGSPSGKLHKLSTVRLQSPCLKMQKLLEIQMK